MEGGVCAHACVRAHGPVSVDRTVIRWLGVLLDSPLAAVRLNVFVCASVGLCEHMGTRVSWGCGHPRMCMCVCMWAPVVMSGQSLVRVCAYPYPGMESSAPARGAPPVSGASDCPLPRLPLPPLHSQSPGASLGDMTQAAGSPQHPSGSPPKTCTPNFMHFSGEEPQRASLSQRGSYATPSNKQNSRFKSTALGTQRI